MARRWIVSFCIMLLGFLVACAPSIASEPTATAVTGPDFTSDLVTALADELKLESGDIILISSEEVQWRDSCLGVERKGMMCMEVITPGYLLVFETPQGNYEAHTNADGTAYIFVPLETGTTPVQ